MLLGLFVAALGLIAGVICTATLVKQMRPHDPLMYLYRDRDRPLQFAGVPTESEMLAQLQAVTLDSTDREEIERLRVMVLQLRAELAESRREAADPRRAAKTDLGRRRNSDLEERRMRAQRDLVEDHAAAVSSALQLMRSQINAT